jgi:hypothetical protein
MLTLQWNLFHANFARAQFQIHTSLLMATTARTREKAPIRAKEAATSELRK